jgi:microcystin-dependent protein
VSSTEPEKLILSGAERELATRLSENPMDLFQGKSIGWLEDFIRITVGGGSGGTNGSGSSGTSAAYYVPGDLKVVINDLTAQTGEYVYSDDSGQWLYCNGVAVSQTTYADLYATVGANAFGTDSGGNFFLPDPRGRALFFTGTHTNTDLGDSDGVALASRQAKHAHTNGATITGTPGGTFASSTHTHDSGTYKVPTNDTADSGVARAAFTTSGDQDVTGSSGTPSATASPTAGDLAVGGTIGTGTTGDAPAHLFIGSLLVRF